MERKIVNPLTGKRVLANGAKGKEVYTNYLKKLIMIENEEDLMILQHLYGMKKKKGSPVSSSPSLPEKKKVDILDTEKETKIDYIVINTGYSKNLEDQHIMDLASESISSLKTIMTYNKKTKLTNFSNGDEAFGIQLHKAMMKMDKKNRPTDYALIRVKGRKKRTPYTLLNFVIEAWGKPTSGDEPYCPFMDYISVKKTMILNISGGKNVLLVFIEPIN